MATRPFTRRQFLAGVGAAGAVTLISAPSSPGSVISHDRSRRYSTNPFTLGVASGDPGPDGIVLWTRLAPDPIAGGGMPSRPVPVEWQVAADERFAQIVATGSAIARPQSAHCVHAEVRGLRPGAWYWYRFRTERYLSPVGRTRTTPPVGVRVPRVAFTLTSCQRYSHGFYTAHRHMADEAVDAVVQVGDYVYQSTPEVTDVRPHEGEGEPVTLEQYRNRHAQYRTDADLQACHAAFPWLVVLDDHEIDNNWADQTPDDPNLQSQTAFLARRAAALQAYYEHMPLSCASRPRGIDMQLYRRIRFGDLLDVHLLDTRQYRSDQNQQRRLDPTRTMLGSTQRRWLLANLAQPTARWNALAQQVFFSQRDLASGPAVSFSDDAWDNYVVERNALRDQIAASRVSNPVILTGDVHTNYVCDVKADFGDPASASVATELVGTSISTDGDGVDHRDDDTPMLAENPHIQFVNHQRGYVRNIVTPDSWIADFRVLDYVTSPGSAIHTRASFAIDNGRPGAVPA